MEEALRALADPGRRRILTLVRSQERTAGEIAAIEYTGAAFTPTPDLAAEAEHHAEEVLGRAAETIGLGSRWEARRRRNGRSPTGRGLDVRPPG